MDRTPIYDIYDYTVLDRNGRRLGPITGFWVDETTGQPEFASVKTGWILGKNHVIPIRDAHFDYGSKMLRVPYEERVIRDAPGFAPDHDLARDEEERVYAHYRLGRGLAGDRGRPGADRLGGGRREAEIPLHEEKVRVGKRTVEEGGVRLRKVVKTDVKQVPVELTRERIEIERVPPSQLRGTFTGRAFDEDEILLRERREEPVVEKSREVVGGVRATTETDRVRENVRADVRREDVEVEREADARRRYDDA
ncbi:MAG TPA: PRC and DUF2382 domain-containing protein [Candidatus Thermoplasmatota archaeon]|nr:PRC and DUF2382 domain-containing protein [Candidatus Thermoplasmatota archaeon]